MPDAVQPQSGTPFPMVLNRPPVMSPPRPGAGGPAAGRATRRRGWDALLICLAAYILTAVGRLHQIFTPLGYLKPLLVASMLAIVFYAVDHSAARRLGPVLRLRTTRWAIALLFWAALSVVTALHKGFSLATFLDSLPKAVAMFVITVAATREWKDVERLAYVYFAAVAIYAAVILVRFQITAEKWRLESLYYYDANDFATLAVTALPISLYFLVQRRNPLYRMITLAGMACLLISFTWTGSRGGLIALLAVGGFMMLRYKAIRAGWRVSAVAVILLLLVGSASDTYWQKMDSILHPKSDYNMSGPWGRIEVWKRGIGYTLQFPLLGVGYANFPVAEGTLFGKAVEMQSHGKGAKWGVAHNSFIETAAELGIPGLFFYVAMLLGAFSALRSVRAFPGGPRDPPNLAQALTASLLGFVVGAFFLSLEYSDLVFALCAFATALAKTTRVARLPAGGRRQLRMSR